MRHVTCRVGLIGFLLLLATPIATAAVATKPATTTRPAATTNPAARTTPAAKTTLAATTKPTTTSKLGATSKPAATTKPAPTTASSKYTEHDYRRGLLKFNQRTMAEAYRQIGERDPKWDKQAEAFLDIMALRFTNSGASYIYALPNSTSNDDAVAAGRAAIDEGCTDPLVRYCYGAALEDAGQTKPSAEIIELAMEDLYQSRYPLNRAIGVTRRRIAFHQRANEPAKVDEYLKKYEETLLALLSSWQFDEKGIDRRAICITAFDPLDEMSVEQMATLYSSAKDLPNSDAWLVNIIGGRYHVRAAWESRGGGWASNVTPEGWKGFFDHLAQARDCYVAAWKLRPDYPEAAAEMITVAMGGSDDLKENPRRWFDRAIAGQFDYAPAYYKYLHNLSPSWNGGNDELYAFGLECLKTGRFDTHVPDFLYDALARIETNLGSTAYWKRPGVYTKVKTYYEGKVAAQKDERARAAVESLQAVVAWKCEEFGEMRRLLDTLGDQFMPNLFALTNVPQQLAISQAHAMTGPHADVVRAAEKSAESGKIDAARQSLEGVAKTLDAKDPAAFFVRTRAQELTWQAKFDAGEWVDIQPDADMTGWQSLSGEWSVDAQGRLVGVWTDAATAICRLGFLADDYELEGVVEFDPNRFTNGGPVYWHVPGGHTLGVSFRRKAGVSYMMVGITKSNETKVDVPDLCAFRVERRGPLVTVDMGEKTIFTDNDLGNYFSSAERYVGVAGYYNMEGRPTRFSNLRLRKLPPLPAAELRKRQGQDGAL